MIYFNSLGAQYIDVYLRVIVSELVFLVLWLDQRVVQIKCNRYTIITNNNITFARVLFRAVVLLREQRHTRLPRILILQIHKHLLLRPFQLLLLLEVVRADLELRVEPLLQLAVLQHQVVVLVLEHWVVWRDDELVERLLHLTQQVDVLPIVQVILLLLHYLLVLLMLFFIRFFTIWGFTLLFIILFVFIDLSIRQKLDLFFGRL